MTASFGLCARASNPSPRTKHPCTAAAPLAAAAVLSSSSSVLTKSHHPARACLPTTHPQNTATATAYDAMSAIITAAQESGYNKLKNVNKMMSAKSFTFRRYNGMMGK